MTPSSAPSTVELRRGVLAVSVLSDLDTEPSPLGVTLPGTPSVWVGWGEVRQALAGHHPETPDGRERLGRWLLARRWAADLGPGRLAETLRPVGLPLDHVLHPGLDWVQRRVLGGAMDLGLGAVGLDPADRERVVLLPPTAIGAAGLDTAEVWAQAEELLERMGLVAVERLDRDRKGQLRAIGDCDVVTLLGSATLRAELARRAGGLAALAVPMLRRGWTRLALIDPAFGAAAAAATAAEERGFSTPVLVTADEVAHAVPGGRPEVIVLRDPAPADEWDRDVLYR